MKPKRNPPHKPDQLESPPAGAPLAEEGLSREEIAQRQWRMLQAGVAQLLDTNAFYRAKLKEAGVEDARQLSSWDDYRRLPFTRKSELSSDQEEHPPYGTNLTYPLSRYVRVHQTSGTKGEPLRWLDTEESWQWWARCWQRVYQAAGVNRRDRIFFAFSFGPFIGFWSAHEGARHLNALAIPGGGMSSIQRLQALLTHRATVLVCTPTYALHLAEVAAEEQVDLPSSSIRVTIQAGEPGAGLPATRARIEEAWGARCYDHAGATEVGAWGYEGKLQNGLFVNEREFVAEVLDPDSDKPVSDGELVLTNLGRFGMPVLRYRTGDRVRLASQPSPCGRTFQRLEGGIIGRVDDVLLVRGINIYPSSVENIVRRIGAIGEFSVEVTRRESLDEMEVRIEVDDSADEEDVASQLSKNLRNALGLRATVTPVPFGSLPRFDLKARRFKDLRE
ncbi:MAG TPA: phenylacetate--CoA ligase family protein [Acidobacteriota bacterium]|nr:phenylacetate--CoA ligase family protein [Acidobacteriota bacterium]